MRESFSKQRGGQITVAGVGQQDDDVLACVLGTLCQLDGSPDSSTGRDAHQNAFLVADQAAGGKGVVIFDGDDLVVDLGVQHVGDEACADALDLVRTGEVAGSTATTLTPGFLLLRYWPTPVMVPPVPTPATKMSTLPSVSSQISGPVVAI